MLLDEFDVEFLNQKFQTIGHLFSYLSLKYGSTSSRPLHAFVLLPSRNVTVEKIRAAALSRDLTFDVKEICDRLYRADIGVKVRKVHGYILTAEDWWVFLSRDHGEVISSVLIESFVRNHFFSVLSPAYVNPQEMVDLALELQSVYDRIILEEFSMAGERGSLRKWLKSGDILTRDLASSLQKQYDSSFTGVRLTCTSNEADDGKIRLYTGSRLCYLSGSFGDFYQFVLLPYLRKSLETEKRYSNKQRHVDNGKISLHGVIVEGTTHLSKEEIQSIADFIKKQYATEVLHSNPIIILQASDQRDGSSFDVYITEKAVEIIPLTKASSGSLIELCSLIIRRMPPFASFRPLPPIETTF